MNTNLSRRKGRCRRPCRRNRLAWWYYNFRMYSQAVLLCYNLAKLVFEAHQNDMMVIMSAVRCICILTILGRHHYYCQYRWTELSEGRWNKRLAGMIAFSMIGYNVVALSQPESILTSPSIVLR
jgi:hypothetical protein